MEFQCPPFPVAFPSMMPIVANDSLPIWFRYSHGFTYQLVIPALEIHFHYDNLYLKTYKKLGSAGLFRSPYLRASCFTWCFPSRQLDWARWPNCSIDLSRLIGSSIIQQMNLETNKETKTQKKQKRTSEDSFKAFLFLLNFSRKQLSLSMVLR